MSYTIFQLPCNTSGPGLLRSSGLADILPIELFGELTPSTISDRNVHHVQTANKDLYCKHLGDKLWIKLPTCNSMLGPR
jgi:hypothetical protein